jgi:hypothetical protein
LSPPCVACKGTQGRSAHSSKNLRYDTPPEYELTYGPINSSIRELNLMQIS